ncbi:MAG: class I SAM-dependent methyltransferase [Thermodesulfobacteriota bacterium]
MLSEQAVLDQDLDPRDLEGSPALEAGKKLVLEMIAQWPRPKQHLLQIGCGSGYFLQAFLEAGFQVTGTDSSREMLKKSRVRLGAKVDLHLAQPEHLHFEDKEFDYSALINVLEFSQEPEQALLEACRVTKKRLLLLFLNRCSMLYLTRKLRLPFLPSPKSRLQQAHWRSWPELKRLVRYNLGPRPMRAASVLPGPKWTWSKNSWWHLPFPMGAICTVELDISKERLGTPILAWKAAPKAC